MKRYFEQLKPQERRWAVGVGCFFFLMLNYFFVWPHFGDWTRDSLRMEKNAKQTDVYQGEIRHKDEYARKLRDLQSDGSSVLPEDQAIDFVHFYNTRAVSNKVIITSQGQMVTRTNDYFLEQQVGITVQADETNLVNFLYSLGAGNSMMRVRAMSLHPDPSHFQLVANISLVASYQKKAAARTNAAPAAPARVAAAETPKPTAPVIHPATVAPSPSPFAKAMAERTNHTGGPFARPIATNRPVNPYFKKP